jgi:hypothetical protein
MKKQGFAGKMFLIAICCPCSSFLYSVHVSGGSLDPAVPPAPTMRTISSLGYDCPKDAANTTNLLFTFFTNQGGFDTGLSISNTGTDPLGTVGKSGTCTLNFYSAGAPIPPLSTGTIASRVTYVNTASTVATGFQGYMIATCNFPYAHGFAFICDVGARSLAMGYLAQVVCANRGANSMGCGR